MKLQITLTVTVDPDVWSEIYDENVRDGVCTYVFNQVSQSPAAEENAIVLVEMGRVLNRS
jgi:hypothetical protein